ncbi:MAG TPA: amino acid permease [Streptosporangiales bacterium]
MQGQLRRTISIPQGVALYVGAVLGAGVLLLPGLAASRAGPASLVAWAFDCALGVPLALTFAALAAHTPDAGGVSTYATRAFGGAVGTVVGWYYFVAAATAQALVALTGAYYVAPYLRLDRAETFALAAAVLLLATLANLWGLRVSGRLQLAFSGVVAVLLVLAIGTAIPRFHAAAWTPFAPHGTGAVGAVGVTVFFAFFGWEAISHLSEEFADPERAVPRSTAISVGVITVLYVGLAVATVGTGTYGTGNDGTTVARLLSGSLGEAAGMVASAVALAISLGTANAFVAATSRLGYALARAGAFPSPLARVGGRGVPTVAVLVVGGWALACLGVSYAAGWTASTLLVVPNSLVILVYLSATLAAARLFRGSRRVLALVATVMVAALVPFAGVVLVIPVAVAVLALGYRLTHGRRRSGPTTR